MGPHVSQAAIQTSRERGLRRIWDLAGPSESAPPPGRPLRIAEPGHQTVQERGGLAGPRDRAGWWGNQIRGLRADREWTPGRAGQGGASPQARLRCGPVGQVGHGGYSRRSILAGHAAWPDPSDTQPPPQVWKGAHGWSAASAPGSRVGEDQPSARESSTPARGKQ